MVLGSKGRWCLTTFFCIEGFGFFGIFFHFIINHVLAGTSYAMTHCKRYGWDPLWNSHICWLHRHQIQPYEEDPSQLKRGDSFHGAARTCQDAWKGKAGGYSDTVGQRFFFLNAFEGKHKLHPGKLTWNPKCRFGWWFSFSKGVICYGLFRFQPFIFRGVWLWMWWSAALWICLPRFVNINVYKCRWW